MNTGFVFPSFGCIPITVTFSVFSLEKFVFCVTSMLTAKDIVIKMQDCINILSSSFLMKHFLITISAFQSVEIALCGFFGCLLEGSRSLFQY